VDIATYYESIVSHFALVLTRDAELANELVDVGEQDDIDSANTKLSISQRAGSCLFFGAESVRTGQVRLRLGRQGSGYWPSLGEVSTAITVYSQNTQSVPNANMHHVNFCAL